MREQREGLESLKNDTIGSLIMLWLTIDQLTHQDIDVSLESSKRTGIGWQTHKALISENNREKRLQ